MERGEEKDEKWSEKNTFQRKRNTERDELAYWALNKIIRVRKQLLTVKSLSSWKQYLSQVFESLLKCKI